MNNIKSLLDNDKFVVPISVGLAVGIPWVITKIYRGIRLRKRFRELAGKVVVITGASSGVGEALAHEFYKHGAQVILCARRRPELHRVKDEILQKHNKKTAPEPIIIPLDLTDTNDLLVHARNILSLVGKIDILVNNGGISHRSRINDSDLKIFERIMAVNFIGAVALTKAVLPDMLKRKQGQIVFISSINGLIATPANAAYCASKHALQAFGDSLRAEVALDNISVCMISPGYVKTQISLNALTATGGNYGKMDAHIESGYTAEYSAKLIVRAIAEKKKEFVFGTFVPKVAIFLRKFFPALYFYAMIRRANMPPYNMSGTSDPVQSSH